MPQKESISLFEYLRLAFISKAELDLISKSPEILIVIRLCSQYPKLKNWICEGERASLKKCLGIISKIYNQKPSFLNVLSTILNTSTPADINLIISNFQFSEFRYFCSGLSPRYPSTHLPEIFLSKYGEAQATANWGKILNQLDFIIAAGSSRKLTEHQLEVKAAQALYQVHDRELEASDFLVPGLRTQAGGHLRDDSQLKESSFQQGEINLGLLKRSEQENFYQYLESETHPLRHLLVSIGVEAEVRPTLHLKDEYELLGQYVLYQGGYDFEFSAKPVRQVETLVALYQKFFDAGFIDLLTRRDHSLHWNLGTTDKDLTIHTLSIMLLTGLVSTGRTDIGIRTKTNYRDLQRRYEWKQGNLVHSETFRLGLEFMHSIATAQKAYEFCSKSSNQGFATSDQRKLSEIYSEFLQKSKQFLDEVGAALEKSITGEVIEGSQDGMLFSARALIEVFPTLDSFIEVDPAVQFAQEEITPSKTDPEIQYVRSVYLYLVAKAQELASHTHKLVREVLAEAEADYHSQLMNLAEHVLQIEPGLTNSIKANFTDLEQRYPQKSSVFGSPDKYIELYQRFEDYLQKPGLSLKEKVVLRNAVRHLLKIIEKRQNNEE